MSSGSKKVAPATGAARGIGLATAALRFLDDGWHVAMLDILGDTLRSAANALEPCRRHPGARGRRLPMSARVQAAVEQTQRRFGRIDALVNNAGIAVFKPMLDVTLEEWQRVLAVNLTGPFLMTRGGGADHARPGRRRHRQHHLDLGPARLDPARRLRHQQGGAWRISPSSRRPSSASTASASTPWRPARSIPPWPRPCHTPAIRADYHDHIPLNRYGLEHGTRQRDLFPVRRPGEPTSPARCSAVDGGFDRRRSRPADVAVGAIR